MYTEAGTGCLNKKLVAQVILEALLVITMFKHRKKQLDNTAHQLWFSVDWW